MSIIHNAVTAAALISASSANASSLQDRIVDSILGRSAVTSFRQMPASSAPEGRFEDRLAAAISPPVMLSRAPAGKSFPPSPSGRGEADIQDRIIASISGHR